MKLSMQILNKNINERSRGTGRIICIGHVRSMGGSPGDVCEEPVTQEKRKKGWRMNCDVGEATGGLENELWRRESDGRTLLILQPFRHFTYVTSHSPTLPSLYLRHNSFSNISVASPTSQLCSFSNLSVTSLTSQVILQPFCRFTYVTAHSPTLPLLHLRHSSFSNPSFASPTSQALHLIHLASGP